MIIHQIDCLSFNRNLLTNNLQKQIIYEKENFYKQDNFKKKDVIAILNYDNLFQIYSESIFKNLIKLNFK